MLAAIFSWLNALAPEKAWNRVSQFMTGEGQSLAVCINVFTSACLKVACCQMWIISGTIVFIALGDHSKKCCYPYSPEPLTKLKCCVKSLSAENVSRSESIDEDMVLCNATSILLGYALDHILIIDFKEVIILVSKQENFICRWVNFVVRRIGPKVGTQTSTRYFTYWGF